MKKVSKENPDFIFSEASSLFDKDVDTAIDYVFIHSWKGISDGTSSGRNSSNGDGGADGGSSYDYSSDGGYDGGSGDGGGEEID